jgi:hypothetical protein
VWAGKINFESGGYLVAVEYDSNDTVTALRSRCAQWSSSDTSDVPAAFGVRIAKVGIRRRKIGVVHHGAPVRNRFDDANDAVEAIATFLAEIGRPRPDDLVAVDARAFARADRVALLDIPVSVDVDERPLRRLGITEIPTYRPLLDPSTGLVMVGAGAMSLPLAGVVVQRPHRYSLDHARRRLWSLGDGSRLSWAEFVDELGDRIIWDEPELTSALDRALS